MKKRHVKCLKCGSLKTVRNGKRKNNGGSIQRFSCNSCHQSFCLRLNYHKQIGFKEKVDITRTHLEGRTSIRTIARHKKMSTKTVVSAIHEVTSQCVNAAWIATHLKPRWSGYLNIDGKMIRVWDWAAKYFRYTKAEKRWLHKMSLLIALDLGTLDIPGHHLGSDETAIDLVMFLSSLKEMGYPLKGFVSDGNVDIERSVRKVFGQVPHQLCIRHFLENLKSKLGKEEITNEQYSDACRSLLNGARPKLIAVPDDLFTYRKIKGLPPTNQAIENLIRFLELRLKTLNQFHAIKSAQDYCNALVLMRRFIAFTDCRDKTKNHKAPLKIAGCDIRNLDYLNL